MVVAQCNEVNPDYACKKSQDFDLVKRFEYKHGCGSVQYNTCTKSQDQRIGSESEIIYSTK